ncbi:MAG: 2-oxo-4-hydroxy-4-carboxy-5-ureidoimidazoline decarboxylase [Jatrophihabitantaceae bacterium]
MAQLSPGVGSPIDIAEFDRAPIADAAAELLPCCASRRWVTQLVRGRPYGRLELLKARSDAILARLDGAELADAIAAQPGVLQDAGQDRAGNDPVAEREIARTELAKVVRRQLARTFC